MTIVAHRCGTDLFPESTLAAARHSLALGADYLEIDIRFTRDGVPVISHDADLRRLFGDEEKICKLSAEGFHSRRHIARPDFGPAFLEEFFDAGAGTIRLWEEWANAALIEEIHAAGCLVWIMTGRLEDETVGYTTRERVEFLLAMKADGILINEVGFGR